MASKRKFVSGGSHMDVPQIIEIPTHREGKDPFVTQTVMEKIPGQPIKTAFPGRFPTVEIKDGEYVQLGDCMTMLWFERLAKKGYALEEGKFYALEWMLNTYKTSSKGEDKTDPLTGMKVEGKAESEYVTNNKLVHAVEVEKPEWWPTFNGAVIDDDDCGLEPCNPKDYVAKVWRDKKVQPVKADTESTTATPEEL